MVNTSNCKRIAKAEYLLSVMLVRKASVSQTYKVSTDNSWYTREISDCLLLVLVMMGCCGGLYNQDCYRCVHSVRFLPKNNFQ